MDKQKENVLEDFAKMIYNSWTFDRLTESEQKQLDRLLYDSVPVREAVKGTYRQRWEVLLAVYEGFLHGVGYTDFNWREPEENKGKYPLF